MKLLNKKGFSLIEIMVVLSLMCATVFLCYSSFSWIDHILVRFQLEDLCATCFYLQQRAVAEKKDIVLYLDLLNHTYTYDKKVHQLPKQVRFGYRDTINGPPGSPAQAITKACTFTNNAITFYATGVISSGTVYFVDSSLNCMYALSNAVSQVSYLRLYRYDTRWWLM